MSECMWICHPPAIAICGHCYVRLLSSRRFFVSIYFGPATLPLLSAVRSALEFIISGKLFLGQGDFSGTNFGFNCIADTIIMCGVPLEACGTPKTYQGTHLCIPAVPQSCWCFFFLKFDAFIVSAHVSLKLISYQTKSTGAARRSVPETRTSQTRKMPSPNLHRNSWKPLTECN